MNAEPLAGDPRQAPRQILTLPSAEFRKGRETAWRDLDALIARVEAKGVSALSAEELQRLPTLYRTAISSLSVARAIALDRNLILFLEALALRAYFIVYGPRVGVGESLRAFLRRGFPVAVRANLGVIAFAFFAQFSSGPLSVLCWPNRARNGFRC
jgi:hypothetical protein